MAVHNPRSRPAALAVLGLTALLFLAAAHRTELVRLTATARAVAEGARILDRDDVVLQKKLNDCGPAALATLLGLLGHSRASLDSIGHLSGTTLAGTTAAGLARAARTLGLPLAFARLSETPNPELGPFIAWVRASHFVVVRALPSDRVLILDPQVGRYLLARDRFEGIWSGESLVIAPAVADLTAPSGPESPVRTPTTRRFP